MASLILPSRRVVQPQGPVGIDWGNPLTRGLISAVVPGVHPLDLASNRFPTTQGTLTTNFRVPGAGAGIAGGGITRKYDSTNFPLFGAPSVAWFILAENIASGDASVVRLDGALTALQVAGGVPRSIIWRGGLQAQEYSGFNANAVNVFGGLYVDGGSENAQFANRAAATSIANGGSISTTSNPLSFLGTEGNGELATNWIVYLSLLWVNPRFGLAQLRSLSDNPWQLFRPIQRRIWVPVAGGGGDVTGSLNATETGSDTLASSGTVLVSGALSVTESGPDTFAANGAVVVSGSLAVTESGPDTFAASGLLGTSGSLAVTESGPDTFSATGTTTGGVSGSLDATEAGSDTAAVSGVVVVAGSLTVTESGADTFAASGAVVVTGLLSATESGPDTFEAVGFGGAVTGSLNATESGSDTFFATEEGQLIDTHDGFWAKEWKRIRAREKRKYQEEIQERVEEIQDEIAEVEQQIVEVKQAPKPKKATPARNFYAEQARIVEHLIARRNQLIDEEDEELLLLL